MHLSTFNVNLSAFNGNLECPDPLLDPKVCGCNQFSLGGLDQFRVMKSRFSG